MGIRASLADTKNEEPRTMNSPALNPQPSTLNAASIESLRARYLDHFRYDELIASLNLMATEDLNDPQYGIEFRQRAAKAARWMRDCLARTAPQLPDEVYARFLSFPWERFADRPEVRNPERVETPAETDIYRRRKRNLEVSKAIIAHAASGTDALRPGDRSEALPAPPPPPRQAQRGEAPLRLEGPVLGSGQSAVGSGGESELAEYSELITFFCHRCGRDRTGPQCTAFDGPGTMCVPCSLKHTEEMAPTRMGG